SQTRSVSKRFRWLQARRARCRVETGQQSNRAANNRGKERRGRIKNRSPRLISRDPDDDHDPEARANDSADYAHGSAFGQELHGDMTTRGANGATQPDLASALHDAHERDVRNAERTHDKG